MKNRKTLKITAIFLAVFMLLPAVLSGCGQNKELVVIYTSIEEYVIDDLSARLEEAFPEYKIKIEYMSTGNHAAKLLAEGTSTDCDITYDLEYAYLTQLAQNNLLADLSSYDQNIYVSDTVVSNNYLVHLRNSGAVILNTEVLKQKNLPEPTSYADLLKPEYANLISMPSPKSSSTGYMFLKNLVNAWGEAEAFEYFDKLSQNILQYTSSGSGPVNALVQGEVAIGLGMTAQGVLRINEGEPLKIVYFEEGAPFTLYGQAIVAGKEEREAVKKVFDFMVNTYGYEFNEKFYPEQIFKDKTYTVKNYPQNINYADMSNNTIDEKNRLLDKWKY